MRVNILSILIVLSSLACLNGSPYADEAEVKATADKVKDQKLKDHLLSNIEIFGKTDLSAIYIFAPGAVDEEELKGSLITRDFTRDPFFMQNIDREEFEMKVVLREWNGDEEDKKPEIKR
jgi:hypothetical protein